MSDSGKCTVHVTYPRRVDPRDDAFLARAAGRHNGQLAGGVMESFPAQHRARFESDFEAEAFIAELVAAGGWRAGVRRGWHGTVGSEADSTIVGLPTREMDA